MKIFKGRPIIPGNTIGEALVSKKGFNTLASFSRSIIAKEKVAICSDQDNKELYNKVLTQKILIIPKTIGSTTAGLIWLTVAKMNIQPKALVFTQKIDSLAVAGLVLTEVWLGKKIIAVDSIGDEIFDSVKEGDTVEIKEDGTVIVY